MRLFNEQVETKSFGPSPAAFPTQPAAFHQNLPLFLGPLHRRRPPLRASEALT
jgi:hypothetical protein